MLIPAATDRQSDTLMDMMKAGQRKGVLIKPKRLVDPDDVLSPEESALVKKAEREMQEGEYVTLAQLHHALDRKRSPGSRKTA
jgi:hypothetical protein